MSRKAVGIRRHGAGWQVYIRVRGVLFVEQFPANTPPTELKEWRRKTRDDYLTRNPKPQAGTLSKNVETYLKTLAHRPRLQQERATQLAWWVARFGHRRRGSIDRAEWLGALSELAATPVTKGHGKTAYTVERSASSIAHYRMAMFHLFTTLDGKDAPNPLREIPAPSPREAEPRAIPYPIIEAIFAVMPDRKHRQKLSPDQIADVQRRLAAKESPSSIGRAVGVSEAMIRKLRDGKHLVRDDPAAKAKARLRVMAYAGGLPPAQMKTIRPGHVDWTQSAVLLKGRHKGKGTRTIRLPIPPQGLEALRTFFAVQADGPFSTSSLNHSFQRGIARLVDRVAATDWRAAKALHDRLQDATAYDLRHSYLTQAFEVSKNIRAVQVLAQHSDERMTHRYTLGAVDPQLQALAIALGASFPPGASQIDPD